MDSEKNSIQCELYDYVEIACLYRYDIRLKLMDDSIIEGKARTTMMQSNKVEALQLQQGESFIEVPLHDIAHMESITPQAKFRQVDFTQ